MSNHFDIMHYARASRVAFARPHPVYSIRNTTFACKNNGCTERLQLYSQATFVETVQPDSARTKLLYANQGHTNVPEQQDHSMNTSR